MSEIQVDRSDSLSESNIPNPFYHRVKFSALDKLQIVVMSVTVFPLRAILLLICLFMMWIATTIATYGLTADREKPMSGWRREMKIFMRSLIRGVLFACGYHRIRVVDSSCQLPGESKARAPIVVGAPHTSFFDAIIMFACEDFPTGVSRIENGEIPFLGATVKFTQPVYVMREDRMSRQKTIAELKRRATSSDSWPEIVIFPEGTCTNGQSLIAFKPGAFIPGVAVRPVVIRHKNRMNTAYWTWDGPGAYTVMWLTLCQFSTEAVMERLPVYVPNSEEQQDPKLFASNVRKVMAEALKIPVSDHSFEDCRLMLYSAKLGLPSAVGILEFQKLTRKLGVQYEAVKDLLEKFSGLVKNGIGQITLEEFSSYLELPISDSLRQLFLLYDRNCSGTIDFREYIIGLHLVSQPANTEDVIRLAFEVMQLIGPADFFLNNQDFIITELFDEESKGYITEPELVKILHTAFGMNKTNTKELFRHIDLNEDGKISYEEFKAHAEKKPEYAKLFLTYRQLMKSENVTNSSVGKHENVDKKNS